MHFEDPSRTQRPPRPARPNSHFAWGDLLPETIVFLQKLIQIPSHRGQEHEVQHLVRKAFAERGLVTYEVEVDPRRLAQSPGYCKPGSELPLGPNILAKLPGGKGRSLALNFHVDTAPTGPLENWAVDPYGGEIREGKIFGRGAWDDKAGAALALLVLDYILKNRISLQGDLIFQSVVEDEYTGNGTLAVLEAGFETDAAIILDGSYGPRALVSHPGYTNFQITVQGKAAPSCRGDTGVNAIKKMSELILELYRFQDELNASRGDTWRNVTHPINFNAGTISGGDWPGAVAAKCMVEGQMGFLPPYNLESFRELLRKRVRAFCEPDVWLRENPPQIVFHDLASDPVDVTERSDFFDSLDLGCREVFGASLNLARVTGWCDLRHFRRYKHIPCCLFGPGKGANCHRANEYFEINSLIPHARVLTHVIRSWCG